MDGDEATWGACLGESESIISPYPGVPKLGQGGPEKGKKNKKREKETTCFGGNTPASPVIHRSGGNFQLLPADKEKKIQKLDASPVDEFLRWFQSISTEDYSISSYDTLYLDHYYLPDLAFPMKRGRCPQVALVQNSPPVIQDWFRKADKVAIKTSTLANTNNSSKVNLQRTGWHYNVNVYLNGAVQYIWF